MTKRPHGIRCTTVRGRDVLRWLDPSSGFEKQQTLGASVSAEDKLRAMIAKESELDSGIAASPRRLKWSAFREAVERGYFPDLKPSSQERIRGTFNTLSEHVKVNLAVDLTPQRLGHFVEKLREKGLATATIRLHLRNLKAVLRWGKRQNLIASVPEICMPRQRVGETDSKGRPLTDAELDLMLAAIPAGVSIEERRPLWEFFLRGLWLSGLRIGEAVAATWDDPATIRVDLSGDYPFIHFPAGSHKSGEEVSVPLTPDFAKLLATVPVDQRTGNVFKLAGIEKRQDASRSATKIVAVIGKASGVVVKRFAGKPDKYASAHDFRRSFGERWARVVMPAVLQRMMRHKSILTTMRYYATGDARTLATTIWKASCNGDA